MIDINLVPGSSGRKSRPSLRLPISLPSMDGLPSFDRWVAGIVVAWVVAPAAGAWLFVGARNRQADLRVAIDEAVYDSTRYAGIIQRIEQIRAQQDTIAQKLEIIEEVDAGRYVWAHIMSEVSRRVPDYTWLQGLEQIEGGPEPVFRVSGFTGSNFALTRFMNQLETSPFIRGVRLASSEQVIENDRLLYAFVLEAGYEQPPADVIQTVPLFAAED